MERGVDFDGDSDKAPRHIIEEMQCRVTCSQGLFRGLRNGLSQQKGRKYGLRFSNGAKQEILVLV